MKKIVATSIALFYSVMGAFAQSEEAKESVFRMNGKIYVVGAVLSVICVGIILYLFNLDRKITKLEKNK